MPRSLGATLEPGGMDQIEWGLDSSRPCRQSRAKPRMRREFDARGLACAAKGSIGRGGGVDSSISPIAAAGRISAVDIVVSERS